MAEKLEIIINAKDNFSKTMKSLRGMLPSVKTLAIGAGAATSALGASLFAIANSTAKAGDELQKMGSRLGIDTEALGEYHHAAQMSGVSTETFNMALQRMVRRVAEAAQGTGEAVDAIKELGVPIEELAAMKPDEQFERITEAMQGTETQADRVRLAMKLFDSEGVKLVQMMGDGVKGLEAFREEARALGITFDKTGADEAAAFRDNMLRLQRVFTGIKTQIGQALIPIFSDYGAAVKEIGLSLVAVVKDNKDKITEFATSFLNIMTYLAQGVGYGVAAMIDSWRGLKMIWQVLNIAFLEFMQLIHEGMAKLTDSMASLLDKINFQGQFDSIIERVIAFGNQSAIAMANLEMSSNRAKDALQKLTDEPLAIHKVTDFANAFRDLVAAIGAEGIPPFTDQGVQKTEENAGKTKETVGNAITALHDMWAEYYLTEGEQIDLWYAQQYEKYEGNQDALYELDMVYKAKHKELAEREMDDRVKAEQLANERTKNERMRHLQNLTNIGLIFGKKGMAISKALAIPHAVMATHEAAISAFKAMAGIPIIGPALGYAAAAAAIAYGMAQVGLIKAQTAHTGLTSVPREQAYVLARNERVISEPQNKDLTEFLAGREAGLIEQTNNFSILPNAGNVESLLQMSKKDWEDICEDKILPAFRKLKLAGLTT